MAFVLYVRENDFWVKILFKVSFYLFFFLIDQKKIDADICRDCSVKCLWRFYVIDRDWSWETKLLSATGFTEIDVLFTSIKHRRGSRRGAAAALAGCMMKLVKTSADLTPAPPPPKKTVVLPWIYRNRRFLFASIEQAPSTGGGEEDEGGEAGRGRAGGAPPTFNLVNLSLNFMSFI